MIRILKIWSRVLPVSRNWITLSNAGLSSDHRNEFMHISMVKRSTEKANVNVDLLPQSSNSSTDLDQILESVQTYHRSMDLRKAIETLESIVTKGRETRVENLKTFPEVVILLGIIQKNLRSMSLRNTVYALKQMVALEIPNTHHITQALFQLVRYSINDLTLFQIISLHNMIRRDSSRTPLTEAIYLALPIIFKTQFETQLDRDNIEELRRIFLFVGRWLPDEKLITITVEALVNYKFEITPEQTQSILRSFMEIRFIPPNSESFIRKLFASLAHNPSVLYNKTIEVILRDIVRLVAIHRKMMFYHEVFIDNCIGKYLWEQPSFSHVSTLLGHLNKLKHANTRILDYIASQISNDPSLLIEYPDKLSAFLLGMSIADHKPLIWNDILERLIENQIPLNPVFSTELSKLTLNLVALGYYYPEMLSRVFINYSPSMREQESMRVLILYQYAKTLFPDYNGAWPTEDLLVRANPINGFPRKSYPAVLVTALGGHQYIKTNMKTKLGHLIDQVIVMRKGGFPVAINLTEDNIQIREEEEFVESLEIPAESQVLLILNIPYFGYTINSNKLLPVWSLYIKSIEKWTGHNVVPINKSEFDYLQDQEKLPYFMKNIKNKCPELWSE